MSSAFDPFSPVSFAGLTDCDIEEFFLIGDYPLSLKNPCAFFELFPVFVSLIGIIYFTIGYISISLLA